MPPDSMQIETLKNILENSLQPQCLDAHPWAKKLIVLEMVTNNPELEDKSPVRQQNPQKRPDQRRRDLVPDLLGRAGNRAHRDDDAQHRAPAWKAPRYTLGGIWDPGCPVFFTAYSWDSLACLSAGCLGSH